MANPVISIPSIIAIPADPLPDTNEEPRLSTPHISFTQISMYLRCSMQYYYRYIRGITSPPSLALGIGKGGHTALEINGKHKIKTGDDLATSDLLDLASTHIDIQTANLENFADLSNRGAAKDNAIKAIRIFRERDAKHITPAGVEVPFTIDINEEGAEPTREIIGKIDLITTVAAVEDYKFTSRAKPQNDVDLSPQLTLYGKVFQTLTGKYPSSLGYRMFLPERKTGPDVQTIYRDPALMAPEVQKSRYDRLTFQFRGVEKGIRNGVFVPTDNPQTCGWCGYRDRCQSSLVNDYEAAQIRGAVS